MRKVIAGIGRAVARCRIRSDSLFAHYCRYLALAVLASVLCGIINSDYGLYSVPGAIVGGWLVCMFVTILITAGSFALHRPDGCIECFRTMPKRPEHTARRYHSAFRFYHKRPAFPLTLWIASITTYFGVLIRIDWHIYAWPFAAPGLLVDGIGIVVMAKHLKYKTWCPYCPDKDTTWGGAHIYDPDTPDRRKV